MSVHVPHPAITMGDPAGIGPAIDYALRLAAGRRETARTQ
jgi:4-hydroxy-L-threonine phosphate dehydrogenase PdxA